MTDTFPIACYREAIAQITESVFATMVATPVEVLNTAGPESFGPITAAVYYAGEWRGALLLECSEEQAAAWAAHLLPLPPPLEMDDVRDGIGELANMIAGNLKAQLPRGVGLSVPSVMLGSNYSVRICGGNLAERVVFACPGGLFRITLVEVIAEAAEAKTI